MSELNILLLGVGAEQICAINEAHKLGAKVIGLDGNPEAAGKDKCDWFECLNIMDPDVVEASAKSWNKKVGVDGVIAPAVECGPAVGRVVDSLGLIGIGETTATKLTDKILRRVALDELKIPQPKWARKP